MRTFGRDEAGADNSREILEIGSPSAERIRDEGIGTIKRPLVADETRCRSDFVDIGASPSHSGVDDRAVRPWVAREVPQESETGRTSRQTPNPSLRAGTSRTSSPMRAAPGPGSRYGPATPFLRTTWRRARTNRRAVRCRDGPGTVGTSHDRHATILRATIRLARTDPLSRRRRTPFRRTRPEPPQ
jgi:hypothetical protein